MAKDPAIEITLSENSSGLGAIYEWSGNTEVGVGRMEMINAQAPSSVRLKLTIFAPFAAENIANFSLEPTGDFTKMTWRVAGPAPLMSKIFSIFVSMDEMIGPDFELGLAKLKTLSEKAQNASGSSSDDVAAVMQ